MVTSSLLRRRSAGIVLAASGVMLVWLAPSSRAVHDIEFQLDGNTADENPGDVAADPGPAFDWESFFNSSGQRSPILPDGSRPGFADSAFRADYTLPDTSTYATGSKDTLNINTGWACGKSNNLGDKFDIVNAYSVIYNSGAGLILYFGIERSATEGDGNMGFWFLKDASVDCDSPKGHDSFTGVHKDGDIFVTAEFSDGGTNASILAYRWNGSSPGSLGTTPFIEGGICPGPDHNQACGVVNAVELDTIWPSPDKEGDGLVDVNAFFEGAVNIGSAAGSGCFATFIANTRSSTSLTATIFDFARGSFPTCAPGTTLRKTASASVTYTYTETNSGNVALSAPDPTPGATNPNGGWVVDPSCSSVLQVDAADNTFTFGAPGKFNKGDTNSNGLLDPGEIWTFRCTKTISVPLLSSTVTETNTATGHGLDPLGRDVTWCTAAELANPPAGKFCDQNERDSVTVTITHNAPN
jgi:hypothetical protein